MARFLKSTTLKTNKSKGKSNNSPALNKNRKPNEYSLNKKEEITNPTLIKIIKVTLLNS